MPLHRTAKFYILFAAAIHLAIFPSANASVLGDMFRESKQALKSLVNSNKSKTTKLITSESKNGNYIFKDREGVVITEIPKGTKLMEYGPKAITKIVKEAEAAAKAGNVLGATGEASAQYGKLSLLNKISFQIANGTKEFPLEAWAFFVAIGAMKTFDLLTKYYNDPLAFKHHLEEQTDPVGLFSFYAFMQSSGIFGVILQEFLAGKTNSSLAGGAMKFLTMGMGTLVQSYVGQVLHDHDFLNCVSETTLDSKIKKANSLINSSAKGKEGSCSNLYEVLVTRHQWAKMLPDIMSMTVASFISSFAQSNIARAAAIVSELKIVKRFAIRFANISIPGLGLVTTVSYIFTNHRVQNALLFLIPNTYLTQPTTDWIWENATKSLEMKRIGRDLLSEIIRQKSQNWEGSSPSEKQCENSNDCKKDFKSKIAEFHQVETDWRHFLLQDIYQSHDYWLEYLTNYWNQYSGTNKIYNEFLSVIRKAKTEPTQFEKLFQRVAPLHGVRLAEEFELDGLKKLKANDITPTQSERQKFLQQRLEALKSSNYDSPILKERSQWRTVHIAGLKIDQFLKDQASNNLSQKEKRALIYLRDNFYKPELEKVLTKVQTEGGIIDLSSDILEKGKALRYYNEIFPSLSALNLTQTPEFKLIMYQLKSILGEPKPILEPGKGWMVAFEEKVSEEQGKSIEFTVDDRRLSQISAPLITDYALAGMLCGPILSKKESLTDYGITVGFPSNFLPPRLVNPNNTPMMMTKTVLVDSKYGEGELKPRPVCGSLAVKRESLYITNIFNQHDQKTLYNGHLEYLRENIMPEFLNQGDDFDKWWLENVEPEGKRAMDSFNKQYLKFVKELSVRIGPQRPGTGFTESIRSKLAQLGKDLALNDILPIHYRDSVYQELNFYLILLNELYLVKNGLSSDFGKWNEYNFIPNSDFGSLIKNFFVGVRGGKDIANDFYSSLINAQTVDFTALLSRIDRPGLERAKLKSRALDFSADERVFKLKSSFGQLFNELDRLTTVNSKDSSQLKGESVSERIDLLSKSIGEQVKDIINDFASGTSIAEDIDSSTEQTEAAPLGVRPGDQSFRLGTLKVVAEALEDMNKELAMFGKIAVQSSFNGSQLPVERKATDGEVPIQKQKGRFSY